MKMGRMENKWKNRNLKKWEPIGNSASVQRVHMIRSSHNTKSEFLCIPSAFHQISRMVYFQLQLMNVGNQEWWVIFVVVCFWGGVGKVSRLIQGTRKESVAFTSWNVLVHWDPVALLQWIMERFWSQQAMQLIGGNYIMRGKICDYPYSRE